MGLGLGIAVIIGSAAGRIGLPVVLVLVVGALALLAVRAHRTLRVAIALAVVGLVVGYVAASVRIEQHPLPQPNIPSPLLVELTSDPEVGGRGKVVDGRWTDDVGHHRAIRLFLPSSAPAGRGDRLLVAGGTPKDGDGTIFFVDSSRRIARAGWLDQRRSALRISVEISVRRAIPGSPGALTLGLLTGNDSGLTDYETDALRTSGLSHITAVSGWNVSVVIVTFTLMLRALSIRGRWTLAIVLPATVVYAWLVGLDPPIVRAAIMGAVAMFALIFGRPAHLYTPLALTAAVMVLLDPSILSSLSFQLSFFAMIGMGLTSAVVGRIERRELALIASAVLTPMTATMMTAPIILDRFGYVSIYSVPANLLVSPLVMPLAAIGAIAAAVHSIPIVGMLVASLAWFMGDLILGIAIQISDLPHARLTWVMPGAGLILMLHLLTIGLLISVLPEGRYLRRRGNTLLAEQPAQLAIATSTAAFVVVIGAIVTIVLG